MWYSSPRLYIELHRRGTNACRMVRENHIGLLMNINKKAVKRGKTEVQQLPLLICFTWNVAVFLFCPNAMPVWM
jgi:hypothetical protein